VITFAAPAAVTYTVTTAAITSAFAVATDDVSTLSGIVGVCGPYTYTILEGYSFTLVDSALATLTVVTNIMADIGVYTATMEAKLTNYPAAAPVLVSFSITIVDPCLTTVVTLPALVAFTISAFDGIGFL